MARSKNTWHGDVAGIGVDLETGYVVIEVEAFHSGTVHPVRIVLSADGAMGHAVKIIESSLRVKRAAQENARKENAA